MTFRNHDLDPRTEELLLDRALEGLSAEEQRELLDLLPALDDVAGVVVAVVNC